mmetsp:Transcript_22866/g.56416  ORF Transcript_22866/g.56416 Transcript_22866/m.56416 type:complete len:92 (+) Transcript_22866:19-294(+)
MKLSFRGLQGLCVRETARNANYQELVKFPHKFEYASSLLSVDTVDSDAAKKASVHERPGAPHGRVTQAIGRRSKSNKLRVPGNASVFLSPA